MKNRKKRRKNEKSARISKVKLIVLLYIIISVICIGISVLLSIFIHDRCFFSFLLSRRLNLSLFTQMFLFLWGFVQALLLFYLNQRHEKLIGIPIGKIIRSKIGNILSIVVVLLLFIEFVCYGIGLVTRNNTLLLMILLLQGFNVTLIISIIVGIDSYSILDSCVRDALRYKESWYKNSYKRKPLDAYQKKHPIKAELLVFDLIITNGTYTSQIDNCLKDITKILFSPSNCETILLKNKNSSINYNEIRSSFMLSILEGMVRAASGSEVGKERIGVCIGWCFENDNNESNDDIGRKTILYYMTKIDMYSYEDIMRILRLSSYPESRLYAWCGIWQLYWMIYHASSYGYAYVKEFKKYARDVKYNIQDLLLFEETDRLIIKKALSIWNTYHEV